MVDRGVCGGMQDSHGALRVLVLDLRGQTSQLTVLCFYESVHNAIEALAFALCALARWLYSRPCKSPQTLMNADFLG